MPNFQCHHKFSEWCGFYETLLFRRNPKVEAFFTKVPNSYPKKDGNPLSLRMERITTDCWWKAKTLGLCKQKRQNHLCRWFWYINRLILEFGGSTNTDLTVFSSFSYKPFRKSRSFQPLSKFNRVAKFQTIIGLRIIRGPFPEVFAIQFPVFASRTR